MREPSPDISTHVAQQIAHELFHIEGSVSRLPGERDLNFLVTSAADRRYVLKISVDPAEFTQIRRQTQCLEQLPTGPWQFPSFVRAAAGPLAVAWDSPHGQPCLVRMAVYCPGIPWGIVKPNSSQLFRAWGNMLGWLDRQLANINHPDADEAPPRSANGRRSHGERTPSQCPFVWDLSRGVEVLHMHSLHLTGELEQNWLRQVLDIHERYVRPYLPELPLSLIHNDANDFNVLLQRLPGQRCAWQVTGLIDFGDMIVGHTINELAIALAYAVLDGDDELHTASCLVQGYHQYRPLLELEVDVLWGLVLLRQAVSLANAAAASQRDPGNHYLTISQQPMQRSLPRLLAINPRLPTAALRTACGWSASRATTHVLQWLRSREGDLRSVLPNSATSGQPATVDLSVGSDQLRGDPTRFAYSTSDVVQRALIEQGAVWGLGGYDEPRLVYVSDQFATVSDGDLKSSTCVFEERRTFHLGLDWFAPAKTPVIAPLDGEVAAALEIDLPLDYGGVIVLKHWTAADIPFYSLFGHLSRDSIRQVAVGQRILAGESFGELGDQAENGGWAPHLHLQLIVDDLGMLAEFPGVCRASQRAVWTALSPDPAHLVPA
ncbi:MAG TPA: phosphotransferase, partial [Pirellulaceae bacterium]|nr:phosphotransferase [Pirellulaceae bacterium]